MGTEPTTFYILTAKWAKIRDIPNPFRTSRKAMDSAGVPIFETPKSTNTFIRPSMTVRPP